MVKTIDPDIDPQTIACGEWPELWWMYQPDIYLTSYDWNNFVEIFMMGTANEN